MEGAEDPGSNPGISVLRERKESWFVWAGLGPDSALGSVHCSGPKPHSVDLQDVRGAVMLLCKNTGSYAGLVCGFSSRMVLGTILQGGGCGELPPSIAQLALLCHLAGNRWSSSPTADRKSFQMQQLQGLTSPSPIATELKCPATVPLLQRAVVWSLWPQSQVVLSLSFFFFPRPLFI